MRMNNKSFVVIGWCIYITNAVAQLFCSELLKRNEAKFYPIRHCQRSNKTQICAKNVVSVEKCADYAANNQALAFNYGHGRKLRRKINKNNLINLFDIIGRNKTKNGNRDVTLRETSKAEPGDYEYFNCQILSCPEVVNMSTMINDTRYDYYTLYANPIPPANATCLPSIGLFIYYYDQRMNHTIASNTCGDQGSLLAQILSSTRTNFLSSLVAEYSTDLNKNPVEFQIVSNESEVISPTVAIRHAFIGLTEVRYKGKFFDSHMVPIECFRYRAWAPHYPSEEKKMGCVAITDSKSWKMFDCRKRMPFICELNASGPSKMAVRLNRKCSLRRPNNKV